tara:strand:+ start:6615 stop:6911 length:297 start_codon:yes stop_codon:yes gene_type:complete
MLKKRQESKWTLDSKVIVNHIKYDRDVIWNLKNGHFRIRTMSYLYLISVLKILIKHSGFLPLNEDELEAIQRNNPTLHLIQILKTEIYYRDLINQQNN